MKRHLALLAIALFPAFASCEPAKEAEKPAAAAAEKAPKVRIKTSMGDMIDGFMIQGGGFAVTDGKLVEKASGKGIKNEGQNGLKNERGTIAMARTNDPDSATAQFFINVVDNAMLNFPSNGGYAVFGKVIEGMDVVDKIKAAKTGVSQLSMRHPATGEALEMPSQDVPAQNVVITSATIE